ncbi:MAG: glycosyl transferase [Leeuwenhoekiella sp.]|nr:MAG: glycosyl transferase [Leeuwenhoekiella sp.]
MLNILFFIHSLSSGGAERVTTTLANHWASKGWAVTVVTVAGENQDFYNLDERIRRIALNMAVNSRTPLHAILNNLRRVWALRHVLRQQQPDVAVAMMTTANATLAMAGRWAGVVTIGSERTYPPAMPLGRLWETIRRRTYRWLDCLVAQTEESARWLFVHACSRRVAVISNPLSFPLVSQPPTLDPQQTKSTLNSQNLLLAVGRLGEEKRFDRLLTAFATLIDRHSNWGLVILGQGPLRETLLQQVVDLELTEKVVLPGAVGNVGDWFSAADLYVLTSHFEGFPNTLVEALAHGLPSVAVNCKTGPSEILRHEIDGILVPQDDPTALVSALDLLMRDSALRERFSERAIEARERFAVKRIADQWEELFRELV